MESSRVILTQSCIQQGRTSHFTSFHIEKSLQEVHQSHQFPNLQHGKLACDIDIEMYKRRPNIPSTSFHLENIKRQSPTNKQPHSLQTLTRTHQLHPYPKLSHGKLACYIDTLRSITRPNSPVTSFHVKNVKRLSSTNQ